MNLFARYHLIFGSSKNLFLSLMILFLCSVSQICKAQTFEIIQGDTVNMTDANGLRQGRWLVTNKTKKLPGYGPDQLIEETNYKDGKKEGIKKQYYADGKLKSEVPYQNNIPKGNSRTYYPNGNLSEEGTWKNGGWDGVYKYYYENGKLSYEWNFVNGKREGEQKYYFPNGKLNYIGNWKDGSESGVLKEYNDAGLLVAEKSFNEGKLDEGNTTYYSTPKEEKGFSSTSSSGNDGSNLGVFDGSGYFKLKNKNGQVSKEGNFANGQLMDGKQYQYATDSGKLIRTIIYKDGKILQTLEE
jgi:antitoxin component YwqK of YwqJK toxin-antitoxin module